MSELFTTISNHPYFDGEDIVVFSEDWTKFRKYFFENKECFIPSEEGGINHCTCHFKYEKTKYLMTMDYGKKLLKFSLPYSWFD